MTRFLHILLFLCLLPWALQAQENADSLRISLLTCEPGELSYERYGHTALRVENFNTGDDLAFNYGLFNQSQGHFVWRFVLGETDYRLGAIPFSIFVQIYAQRGSAVTEQELNLTREEKARLLNNLMINLLPEHCVYRYNFLYKNCTTMARDQIELAAEGRIIYPAITTTRAGQEGLTYRNFIDRYAYCDTWTAFGQNLLLGADMDKTTSGIFLPQIMQDYAEGAVIEQSDGQKRPLVKHTSIVAEPERSIDCSPTFFTPLMAVLLLSLCSWFIFFVEYRKGMRFWGYDAFFMGLQGGLGCLVTLMFFFSEHPTVGSNILVALFNPIPLLYLPRALYLSRTHRRDPYHLVACIWLGAFITLVPLLSSQKISIEVYVLAYNLLALSVIRWFSFSRQALLVYLAVLLSSIVIGYSSSSIHI